MRLGIDATPLLGARTGIGTYVDHLIHGLAAGGSLGEQGGTSGPGHDLAITATAFSSAGSHALSAHLPDSVRARGSRAPARLLQQSWSRTGHPKVETLCGDQDVFHATNFVLPPLRHAAGVLTVHDLSYLRFPHTVTAKTLRYRDLVPDGIRRAAIVTTLSQSVADEIVAEYRIDEARVIVASPGVDASWFDVSPLTRQDRTELDLPSEYFLAVGTLEPRKNLSTLIAAYRRLRDERADVPPLVLVGPTGWGPALQLDTFAPGAVRLTGYLATPLLQRVVAAARCLAFPSLYEGFGLPPVEALAAGTAVVASDLAVTREVLGEAADLVAPNDVEGWAAALSRAASADGGDPAVRAARVARARRWTWQSCVASSRKAYELALS
ncbi:glycosyltransferase family 4 protein [Jatrophihabitans sp. DSM 45814]